MLTSTFITVVVETHIMQWAMLVLWAKETIKLILILQNAMSFLSHALLSQQHYCWLKCAAQKARVPQQQKAAVSAQQGHSCVLHPSSCGLGVGTRNGGKLPTR